MMTMVKNKSRQELMSRDEKVGGKLSPYKFEMIKVDIELKLNGLTKGEF